MQDVLARLTDAGVDAFLAYGALLGAVREGTFIAHDPTPMWPTSASTRRRRRHARVLCAGTRHDRGRLLTWRFSAGDFKVIVPDKGAVGRSTSSPGSSSKMSSPAARSRVGAVLRDIIAPLGTVELHGRTITAPADPEALLAITYGPEWRVPDPSFKFEVPRWAAIVSTVAARQRRQSRPLVAVLLWTVAEDRTDTTVPVRAVVPRARADQHSDRRHRHRHRARRPVVRAPGPRRPRPRLRAGGHRAGGIIADDEDLPARFKTLNLYDIRQVLGIGGELSHRDEPPVLYGRFLIHALRDDGWHNLWRIANMSLRRGASSTWSSAPA